MLALLPSATLLDVVSVRDSAHHSAGVRALSVVFFTILTALAAQVSVPLPYTQVPFTFQPMIVLLAGLTLGSRLGLATQVLYLAAGIAGLPVFATSPVLPPGALRLLGPTGGYLLSYPIAAFVVGFVAERGWGRRYVTSVAAMLIGLALVFTSGVLWLAFFARTATGPAATGLTGALVAGVYPFVLADLVKVLFAAAVVPGLWRLVGRSRYDRA